MQLLPQSISCSFALVFALSARFTSAMTAPTMADVKPVAFAAITFKRMTEDGGDSQLCCFCGGDCEKNSSCNNRYYSAQGTFGEIKQENFAGPVSVFYCDKCVKDDLKFDYIYFTDKGMFSIDAPNIRMND